jgi:dienelactone hydrolase
VKKTTVGAYGDWLGRLAIRAPGPLSFRNPRWRNLRAWRTKALRRALECFASPDAGGTPRVRVDRAYEWDGLRVEHLSWQLPFGPRTEAIFLKPAGARGRLPAVLALHSHGGNKWLGWRKVARGRDALPPIVRDHVTTYDSGLFWANEVAKRGYAVLAHDVFPFASRRVRIADVIGPVRGGASVRESATSAGIARYNGWAGGHESVVARALFDAGTTWPGVTLAEDRRALDVLCARRDVNPRRVGCGGLSGGGMRTVWLGGLDERIACAVCVGFMTTWRDFAVNKCWTHTWMAHPPILPHEMDFPEILGLRVPRPTLVLNDRQDQLYTPAGMKRADAILRAVYAKAKAPGAYRCSFYPGLHKFDRAMQKEAFQWFDRWLTH